jgi:glutathione S-transferase
MDNQTVDTSSVNRLISIAVSHYCEKVRWALEWLNIPYVEESHVPLFHRFATRQHGGSSVPVLVNETGAFTDSSDILHYLNTIAPEGRYLYPTDPELCREVEQLEEVFDTQLGVNIRCWGYFYRLDDNQMMWRMWSKGTPWFEQVGLAIAFPLMRQIVRQAYNVTASSAASSLEKIQQVFQTVNERLADGRLYLVGDNFSAADLTFAALAAPALRPPEHPMVSSQTHEIKSDMLAVIQELRATPAGAYALRLYREQRHPS